MRAGTVSTVALIGAIVTGCATPPTVPPPLVLRAADGPVRIYTDEIARFRCERGPLICDGGDGRLSLRRCRCIE